MPDLLFPEQLAGELGVQQFLRVSERPRIPGMNRAKASVDTIIKEALPVVRGERKFQRILPTLGRLWAESPLGCEGGRKIVGVMI
jgi:hypothetical protein